MSGSPRQRIEFMKWAIEKICRWENKPFSNVRQLSEVGHHLICFFPKIHQCVNHYLELMFDIFPVSPR